MLKTVVALAVALSTVGATGVVGLVEAPMIRRMEAEMLHFGRV